MLLSDTDMVSDASLKITYWPQHSVTFMKESVDHTDYQDNGNTLLW